jgi:hypothetical protein
MKTINATKLYSLIESSDKIVLGDGEIPFSYCEISISGKTTNIVFLKNANPHLDANPYARCELNVDEFIYQIVQDGYKITITNRKNTKENYELTLFKLVPIEELP